MAASLETLYYPRECLPVQERIASAMGGRCSGAARGGTFGDDDHLYALAEFRHASRFTSSSRLESIEFALKISADRSARHHSDCLVAWPAAIAISACGIQP